MTETQLREHALSMFTKHTLEVVANTGQVQMFICRKPDTSEFSFQVVCADNMICLTGDVYSMLVEPGYGRSGLSWMRGSIDSESYFLGKIKNDRHHYDFDPKKVKKALLETAKQYYEEGEENEHYNSILSVVEKLGEDDKGHYGEQRFYDLWYKAGLDEAPNLLELTPQTIYQLTAIQTLCRLLDETKFVTKSYREGGADAQS